MIQPDDCLGVAVLDAPAPVRPGVPAAWFLLVLFVALFVFELWALQTGHNTVSHFLQRMVKAHRWLAWLGGLAWIVLGWHLLLGGPL